MLRIGISHFVSFDDARKYYAPYGYDGKQVRGKIAAGEIYIGKPKLKRGQMLAVIKGEGRYCIIEEG